MGWGGGTIFLRILAVTVDDLGFLPCSGLVADWLHSIVGVSAAMLWWVNWCQFFGGFMGFSCTHGANASM